MFIFLSSFILRKSQDLSNWQSLRNWQQYFQEKLGLKKCDSGNNQDENNLGVADYLVVIMVISQENVQFGVIRRNKSSWNLMIILDFATS